MQTIRWTSRLYANIGPIYEPKSVHYYCSPVGVKFQCETQKLWVCPDADGGIIYSRIETDPQIKTSLTYFYVHLPDDDSRRLLSQELCDYDLGDNDPDQLPQLLDDVIRHARILARSGRGQYPTIVVRVKKEIYIADQVSDIIGVDGVRMVPAHEDAIRSLAKKEMEYENIGAGTVEFKRCMVCLEEMVTGVEVSALPCSHVFHSGCVGEWLTRSHYCPLCRYEMPV